jgi:branched-chain amino acid transport system ATP-binding protein
MTENTVLRVDGIEKRFGSLVAVNDVSFALPQEHTKSLIGPNGAGKTTLINCVSGMLPVDDGRVRFNDHDITDAPPHERAQLGLGRTFQITNLFDEFSVRENVRLAAQINSGDNLDMWSNYETNQAALDAAERILSEVGLSEEADATVSSLSHGLKRQLEIAVAIAIDPETLLLDEPTAGMATENVSDLIDLLTRIQDAYSIILIEHNIDVVMEVSDSVMVMDQGELIADATPDEIRNDERVLEAYLGTDGDEAW